jgi:subtilisin family serine protease
VGTDVNEEELPLSEFLKLPTTVDFETINSDRFKLFAKEHPYLRVGTELASGYVVVYTNKNNLQKVFSEMGENYLSFYPRILSPLDEQSNYDSGITQILNQPYLDVTGRNVIIGLVDTGIDFTKDAFCFADGSTKILNIWDQTVDGPRSPDVYYGSVYTKADIDAALSSERPFAQVPTRDTDGHGTFLASVAAGSGKGEYVGAAPGASIIAVKLRRAHAFYIEKFLLPEENPNLYEETDYLLGIKYILDRSEELNLPVVICIGMGSNMSGHDGNTRFEEYINFVSQRTGYVFVAAGGNESNAKHHTQGTIARTGATDTINLRVGEPNVSFRFTIYGTAYDKFSIGVTSPTGETLARLPFRAGFSYSEKLIFEDTTITVGYYKDINTFIVLEFRNATQGIWEVRLYGDSVINGEYYSWLPITGQVNESVEFLKPVPEYTIVFPATGMSSITCGAYNSFDDSLFVSSSWGPTRQPRMSPDLTAPGVGVNGIYPTGNGTMSGTSVSAAVTAGAAALLLEWGIVQGNMKSMNGDTVRILLSSGCRREDGVQYPNVKWGYGKMNLFGTFSVIKETNINYNVT